MAEPIIALGRTFYTAPAFEGTCEGCVAHAGAGALFLCGALPACSSRTHDIIFKEVE